MASESYIERAVVKYARSKGMLSYKLVSVTHRGLPDRLFIYAGEIFFVEFKTKEGRLSRMQEYIIDELYEQSMDVFVVDSVKGGKRLIDAYLKGES